MSKGGLPGQLPEHMRVGRGSGPGPFTGPYITIDFGPVVFTDAADNTVVGAVYVPFDLRVMAFAWTGVGIGGSVDVMLHQNATPDLTTPTNILSAVIAVDGTNEGIAKASGTTPTLVEAARNVEQGQFLVLEVDGGGTGDSTGSTFSVVAFPYGHVNANPEND